MQTIGQRGFFRNFPRPAQGGQAVVHRTHAQRGTGLDRRIDLVGAVLADEGPDGGGRVHDLERHGLPAVGGGDELLTDDALQNHGKLHPHLPLPRGGECVDDAVHRVGRAGGVQR